MSLVILGMEMPKACIQGDWYGNCPTDRLWCAQRFAPKGMTMGQITDEQQDKLPDWCPLRPLPEKHGDLIDRDVMLFCVLELGLEGEIAIETAPAIVEAEGKDDD